MQDIYQIITDKIVDQLEAATAKGWIMPWHCAAARGPAINFGTRSEYNGVNRLVLHMAQRGLGYGSREWGTYKQWQERGAQVRKGEKGCPVVKYGTFDVNTDNEAADDTNERARRGYLKGYTVFNADQVDGYDAPAATPFPANPDDRLSDAEVFFGNLGADIREGGDRAFFNYVSDVVQMPTFGQFKSAETFYATLAHECTHWTGHGLRLDREIKNPFGSAEYAFEELVAELGAAFLCDLLGLANEPREDHAAYIGSWLKALKQDRRCIFRAAALAQKAVDFMKARQLSPARVQPSAPVPARMKAQMVAVGQLSLF